ncbi:hypothetical protein KGF56_000385 [Candida oxycetoniae]|uniref:aspartyl aminopeptidase n=1 Tax=Candida oxycetoniae TaxID=497107 RepID=A0AAI9T284_9ASCO|nr:uncharacterized protein KGF56_000385 [Candida oxycetoniae]KAI3406780.2 hypothetical protein KGF56_000385 [Candida oxycetoniae]
MTVTTDQTVALKYAQDFVDFVNESPTPYHAVDSVKKMLVNEGFEEIVERNNWSKSYKLAKNGKYFVTRNGSSIIAFTVGGKYENGNGIAIVGAHTDSPCLRIKPISKRTSEGFITIGVEQYGGLIAHTWFDRDLSVAGRVYVNEEGQFVPKLLKIDKPLLRIPTLAIHLNREVNTKFEFNKETKLVPIAGQTALDKNENENGKKTAATEGGNKHSCSDDPNLQMTQEQFESVRNVISRHNKSLIELIAKELNVEPSQIEDFELLLFDHQKSVIGGLNDEFIFSPRLDNLTSCFAATQGLIESVDQLPNEKGIQMISLFDHEEIGSRSSHGADSSFLPDIIQRLAKINFNNVKEKESGSGSVDFFHEIVSKSFLLSSDMAHGIHPNYGEAYESQHRPQVNMGPVIKINANQRYATNSPGIVLIKKVADRAKVPLQLFVVRNDSPCGSTIGPLLSSKLGIRTLDLGNPQLSMHSIRETGGTYDVIKLMDLFKSYFENYVDLDSKILCDHL